MRSAAQRADQQLAPTRREVILDAAMQRFSHYGFRRTSMEDIAQEAGISRAAVYLQFRNKEEIFRALARRLHAKTIAAAENAARESGAPAARIERTLAAKLGAFFELMHDAAHARELLDESSRLCGDISAEFRGRHLRLLRDVIEDAVKRGELSLDSTGLGAAAAAELLLDCAKGIESSGSKPLTPTIYQRRLAQMVKIVVSGLGGHHEKNRSRSRRRK